MRQLSLFEDERLTLEGAIDLSLASLEEYGRLYRHWAVAYSGGKDSSATVTFVVWAVRQGLVPAPERLIVLYADTRQEYPPLHTTAMRLMQRLEQAGIETRVVWPEMDNRFYVYILGKGVPPPSNTFRWCTERIKILPMNAALDQVRQDVGEKLLLITGVRLGESQVRDQRIALACDKNSGECGQGWFQVRPPASASDTLAPLLHWRVCHVFDWLYFETEKHGFPEVAGIASVYGESDVRTGCIGCPLASRDVALENLVQHPDWEHLRPLLELRDLFWEMKKPKWRKRKIKPERRKDGKLAINIQRMGPLTMEARQYFLEKVLDIQKRAGVDLINAEEEARIREMWEEDIWPQRWSADDTDADEPVDMVLRTEDGRLAWQELLIR